MTSLIIPVVLISVFLFVIDFYVEQIALVKLDRMRTFRYGTLTMIFSGLLASLLWAKTVTVASNNVWFGRTIDVEEHELSGGVVFAVVMFAFATDLLASPIRQRSGAFIGYSQEGVPLFNLTHQRSQSLLLILKSSLRDILAESDSRNIFYFLCINLVRMKFYVKKLNFFNFLFEIGVYICGTSLWSLDKFFRFT
jgi:zinc transporter 5/7